MRDGEKRREMSRNLEKHQETAGNGEKRRGRRGHAGWDKIPTLTKNLVVELS